MQGINRKRHQQLTSALLQLENLLAGMERSTATSLLHGEAQNLKVSLTVAELKAKRMELENNYQIYLDMLDALAFHIANYEDFFTEVKVCYVGSRLKVLKKYVKPKSFAAAKLRESIYLASST